MSIFECAIRHLLILTIFSYCGPDAPKFEKSDFEKGKVGGGHWFD